jgi:hypothetical protein
LNGNAVPLQVDAKATNPDGSLRHAVVTALVPALTGGAKLPLTLSTSHSAEISKQPAVTLAHLLATPYDATVSLNVNGTTYTAHARDLLKAADNTGDCKPWGRACNVWLSGPLVSEWVVHGPMKAADGSVNPHIRIEFHVRAYGGRGNAIAYVRTDIVVANDWSYRPQAELQYTATLASGSASYTSPALAQHPHTRWHKVLWWNSTRPHVYLRQDTQYVQATKAVSRYMQLTPNKKFLDSRRQSCKPLHHCDQTKRMHNTGAQAAIGPLPRWTSVYIVDPDLRAFRWMLANNDALGAYGIHYRDDATGWPISIQKHPYVTITDRAYAKKVAQYHNKKGANYKADLLPSCGKRCSTHNPNTWNNAHQPAEGYVAYMVTGSYYYMEEVAFGASHNELFANEAYRGYTKGRIDRAYGQVRGKAWVLREMADAAYLLPDDYPLKDEFKADVENSLSDWNTKYTNNPNVNPLRLMNGGAVYKMHGHGKRNAVAPWQHNFLTWSAGHAAELGFAGAAEFRDWLAKFEIGLMTDWQTNRTQGYCWLEASAYKVQVKDSAGHWLPNYTAVYDATFPSLVGLACNSSEMVRAMGKMQKKRWRPGKMHGYPSSPTGFPANFQIGLAAAADSGLPKAATAWNIFKLRSVKPNYSNYPNFAVVPRSAAGGARRDH